jgi:hypothetical protein
MLRRTIVIALLLWVGETIAFGTDQYGEWRLEKLHGNVIALSTKDMRPMDDGILTAELAFTCDLRHKGQEIGAILIPFEGTYEQNEMEKLITYLKTSERNGVENVHFFFSGNFSGQIDVLNHVKINLSGFTDGISMLQVSCKP